MTRCPEWGKRLEVGKDGKPTEGAVLLHVHPGGGCCFTNEWRQLLSLMLGGGWGVDNGTRCEEAPYPGAVRQGKNEEEIYLLALFYLLSFHKLKFTPGMWWPLPSPWLPHLIPQLGRGQTLPCGVFSEVVGGARDTDHLAWVAEPVCHSDSRRAEKAAGLAESWSYWIRESPKKCRYRHRRHSSSTRVSNKYISLLPQTLKSLSVLCHNIPHIPNIHLCW